MKCRICGRKISNPDSVRNGIGPICYRLIYGDEDEPVEEVRYTPLPGQMSIFDWEVEDGTDNKV